MTASVLTDVRISLSSPLVAVPCPTATNGTASPSAAADPQWDRLVAELHRLRQLENDWDGQGALALDPACVDHAAAWLEEMRRWHGALPPSTIFPGTTGEVVLEWRGDSFQLAAEISTPACVEWLLNLPGQPLKQWETDAHCSWIVRVER